MGDGKHVTESEHEAFLREAERADCQGRALSRTLAYTGCRLSKVLALTIDGVDLAVGMPVCATLKKR